LFCTNLPNQKNPKAILDFAKKKKKKDPQSNLISKCKTMYLQERNRGENLDDLGVDNDIFRYYTRGTSHERKGSCTDFIKLKTGL
jgi:hypothetical protein